MQTLKADSRAFILRKAIAIISLFSLFFALVGYHVAFYLQCQQLKMEMKQNIRLSKNHGDVVTLCFNDQQISTLNWEDEEEFEYQGEMYDVIVKTKKDGKWLIRCIADKKENELLDSYRKDNQRNREDSKWSLLKLATSFYTPASYDMLATTEKMISITFLQYTSRLFHQPRVIVSPPPKMVASCQLTVA